jgi:hypothetical protein
MTLVPELLFNIVEYPIYCLTIWTLLAWYGTGSIFTFIIFWPLVPALGLAAVIGFLFVHARLRAGSSTLNSTYTDWIVLKDPAL